MFRNWWVLAIRGFLLVVLGVYLMNSSSEVTEFVIRLIGIFIALAGLMGLLAALPNKELPQGKRALYQSGIDMMIGLAILFFPGFLSGIISIIIGVWVLINAFSFLGRAWRLRNSGQPNWTSPMIFGLILLLAGGWMIIDPDLLLSSIMFFIGLAVLLFGLFTLGTAFNQRRIGLR
jgi:uncharacterized membrane protein HdeD (DUF308 family)